jgi:hypothetical protein
MRPFGITELVRTGRIAMVRSGGGKGEDPQGPVLHDSSIRKFVEEESE